MPYNHHMLGEETKDIKDELKIKVVLADVAQYYECQSVNQRIYS